MLLRDSFVVL